MLSGVETRPSEWSGVNAWRLVMDKVSMQERVGEACAVPVDDQAWRPEQCRNAY
jgi:hypothetical protein